jgi:uncharacterized protein YbjT (DUF2867 family)
VSAGRREKPVLVTGATGYVGGRLLPALEAAGYRVRCLARRPELAAGLLRGCVEVVQGDVLDFPSLLRAMERVGIAYYLVHSMAAGKSFAESDRLGATHFAAAARQSGVERMIYLGGLGGGAALSPHLRSRQEVGRILRESGIPTIEFRASIILGPGSFSFEMIRALVEKLPIMITPRWVSTTTQPIAIDDVAAYLVAAAELETRESLIFEIGGADRASYGDLMREYARQRKLRRAILPVPVLTPRLSSLWLRLVAPAYARFGGELIEGLRNETVVQQTRALDVFSIRPRSMREAIAAAVGGKELPRNARGSSGARFPPGLLKDSRAVQVDCPPAAAFRPIERIGGQTGWYYANWLWRLRGLVDRAWGGSGFPRRRRDPERLVVGDFVDGWRVEAVEPGRLLRLRAELKLPGRAWLEFEVEPEGRGSLVRQTAIFDPAGLSGLLYWYALHPLHRFVFAGMLRGIALRTMALTTREK